MHTLILHLASLVIGLFAGSLSGFALVRQASLDGSHQSRLFTLLPFIRIILFGSIAWYLLRWGPIPFILFGGSTLIATWIVILTCND